MSGLLAEAQRGGWLQAALLQGLETLSQADVGSALQVYFNLDELNQVGERACQCAAWHSRSTFWLRADCGAQCSQLRGPPWSDGLRQVLQSAGAVGQGAHGMVRHAPWPSIVGSTQPMQGTQDVCRRDCVLACRLWWAPLSGHPPSLPGLSRTPWTPKGCRQEQPAQAAGCRGARGEPPGLMHLRLAPVPSGR